MAHTTHQPQSETVHGMLTTVSEIYSSSARVLEGTREGGPGELAVESLHFTLDALVRAQQAIIASGETGI
ncbi:MAG TPA: hypothetical protein VLH86_03460 [Patescibacteria group bacterium]|nr:hypothetical protein [Patescibacteria group bacterium]